MARIILNEYECECIDDVINAISDRDSGSRALDELCLYYKNGSFLIWLKEGGTSEDLDLAERIAGLKYERTSDSSLKTALKCALLEVGPNLPEADSDVIVKPPFERYARLHEVSFEVNGETKSVAMTNGVLNVDSTTPPKVKVMFTVQITEPINEIYTLLLRIEPLSQGEVGTHSYEERLTLSNHDKGKLTLVEFKDVSMSNLHGGFNVSLFVDGKNSIWNGSIICNLDKSVSMDISNDTKLVMIFVPGNKSVKPFYIGETVVTRQMECRLRGDMYQGGAKPYNSHSYFEVETDILRKLKERLDCSFRLPTKHEWYHAARSGKDSDEYPFEYPGNNDIDAVAYYENNSYNRLHPVRDKLKNELGLFDMAGNVWEMTSDGKTFCGGSYKNSAKVMRIRKTSEKFYERDDYDDQYGIRLACDVEEIGRWLARQQRDEKRRGTGDIIQALLEKKEQILPTSLLENQNSNIFEQITKKLVVGEKHILFPWELLTKNVRKTISECENRQNHSIARRINLWEEVDIEKLHNHLLNMGMSVGIKDLIKMKSKRDLEDLIMKLYPPISSNQLETFRKYEFPANISHFFREWATNFVSNLCGSNAGLSWDFKKQELYNDLIEFLKRIKIIVTREELENTCKNQDDVVNLVSKNLLYFSVLLLLKNEYELKGEWMEEDEHFNIRQNGIRIMLGKNIIIG